MPMQLVAVDEDNPVPQLIVMAFGAVFRLL